jgi:uncharacterized protein YndB with AHSA1/START domain
MKAEPHPLVRVTRRLNASPERVYDAWLDRRMIARWMFGPGVREEVLGIAIDARPGGSFSFLVRRRGKQTDHVIGRYLELDRPRRLVFTWRTAWEWDGESRVTIDIVPLKGGSKLTLTHEMPPKWAETHDMRPRLADDHRARSRSHADHRHPPP